MMSTKSVCSLRSTLNSGTDSSDSAYRLMPTFSSISMASFQISFS